MRDQKLFSGLFLRTVRSRAAHCVIVVLHTVFKIWYLSPK